MGGLQADAHQINTHALPTWKTSIPHMYAASRATLCRPLPPTPTNSMLPPGCFNTLQGERVHNASPGYKLAAPKESRQHMVQGRCICASQVPPVGTPPHLQARLTCSTANRKTASGSGRLLAALWSASASSTAAVAREASWISAYGRSRGSADGSEKSPKKSLGCYGARACSKCTW
jgi:hypothetical protein